MDKAAKYSYYLRNIAVFMIFMHIITQHIGAFGHMMVFLSTLIGLLVNDYLRHNSFLGNTSARYTGSLALSIVVGSILACLAQGYTQIYIFILIYEIVLYTGGKASRYLLMLQIGAFFLIDCRYIWENISTIFTAAFWEENAMDLGMSVLAMAFYILLLYFIKFQTTEKKKLQKLNEQLNESYKMLQEYSERIEELTVSKERNRVAQEIHDSLGHSLTALIMHLDFLEKIIEKDAQKSKELVIKTQDMARNSMKEVRKAVHALKEASKTGGLIDSINELKGNLEISQGIEIHYNIEGNIEEISPDLKNVLYRTIQESFTNGIKHGKATKFGVKLCISERTLRLEVIDNGQGCSSVKEGNGLQGIKSRIMILDGEVSYISNREAGFALSISIPLEEKEYDKDKSSAC